MKTTKKTTRKTLKCFELTKDFVYPWYVEIKLKKGERVGSRTITLGHGEHVTIPKEYLVAVIVEKETTTIVKTKEKKVPCED